MDHRGTFPFPLSWALLSWACFLRYNRREGAHLAQPWRKVTRELAVGQLPSAFLELSGHESHPCPQQKPPPASSSCPGFLLGLGEGPRSPPGLPMVGEVTPRF